MDTTTKARPATKLKAPNAIVRAAARKAADRAKATPAKSKAKTGGVITVKVATLPGVAKDIALERGKTTLQEALRLFGVRSPGDVRVNNKPVAATSNPQLQEGAFVTVVGRVNGGL